MSELKQFLRSFLRLGSRSSPIARLQHFFASQLAWRSPRPFSCLFAVGLSLSLLLACSPTSSPNSVASSPNSVASSPSTAPASQSQTLRIGYQKGAILLNLLKNRNTLEKRLQTQGVSVQWVDFVAGPQMLEALNVGSIDFASVGETPPVTAQAAGAPLVYVATETPHPEAEAILVQKDSPIQSVADLKGKKVVLNKGSNVHYLLVRALEAAGLKYGDIQTIFLPPADARPAFEQGNVDAWVIWDPFLAATQKAIGARILADGKNLVPNRQIYLSTKDYVSQQPEVIQSLLDELKQTSAWEKSNSAEVVKYLSSQFSLDPASIELAEKRRTGGSVEPITDAVARDQQKIADVFFELKLIPKQVSVADVVWKG